MNYGKYAKPLILGVLEGIPFSIVIFANALIVQRVNHRLEMSLLSEMYDLNLEMTKTIVELEKNRK